MEFQQAASAGRGLPVKHPYDGVFGGAVKLGARVEDYREIFGGNGACSIPILDVPELNEGAAAASVDGRSSKVDYSKIFGGFGEADFAVPYDELVLKPKKGKKSSQDVARAQAEAKSRSAQLEHPKFVEEKAVPPSHASSQTLDGTKQINMLYHKTNAGSKSGTNGTTHIAQLHAVPGYTFLIDENTPSRVSKGGKPVYTGLNDVHRDVNVNRVTKEDKTRRKVLSGPQPRLAAENTTKSASDFRKKSTHNRSFSNAMPFDAFDIGLDAHRYKMSPSSNPVHNLGNDKYSSGRSMNSKFGVSRSDASEEGDGNYSPPYFHEEVDANSVAATSAAAVQKAIEEAQVKIRIAKELMERKKSGLQSNVKTSFSNGMKAEKGEVKRADKANRSTEKDAQETHEKKVDPKQLLASSPENNGMKASIVMPNLGYGKESVAEIAVEQINGTHYESKVEHWVEENENRKAGKLFFEPDVTEELKTTILESEQANNGKKLMASASETEPKEEVMIEESFKKSEECDKRLKASEDTPKQEDDVRELDSEEEAFQGHMHTDDIKLDQEPYCQEQYQEEIGVVSKHEEVVQTHKMSCKQENYENELGMLQEPEENAEFEIHEFKVMTELNGTCEWIDIEDDQRESHRQVETENKLDEASMREENNGVLEEIDERKENRKVYSEGFMTVECEKEENSWKQDKNNKEQNYARRREVTEKSSGEINEQEVIEMRFNVILEKDENESKLKQDGLLEENKMLDEAKENEKQLKENRQMNGTEKRQEKTCEIEEIKEITSDIYQRLEDEKNLKTTPEAFRYRLRDLGEAADVCQEEENENPGGADEACLHEDLCEDVEVETTDTVGEYGEITYANEVIIEPNEIKKDLEAVEMANELEEEEKFEGTGSRDFIRINVVEEQSTDITKALLTGKHWWNLDETAMESDHKQHKPHVSENKRDDREKDFSEMTHILGDHNKDVDQSEVGSSDAQNDSDFFSDNEKWFGQDMESETYGDPENDSKGLSCEVEERSKDILECGTTSTHEEDPSYFESFSEERCEDNVTDMEVSEEISLFEKAMERPQEEKTIQESDMKEENHHNSLKMEESGPEENLQNKVEMEKEHRRKKEEEKEREMEKERERIAVERAIREARERAFAEARERAEKAAAERAAAEAHQRRMAESRQRSEKAYAQNNDKSAIEKASMEAKLKAERAAVERATAEARERALEKALSEKAASKARNQAASGNDRMKSSDQQYKGSGLSSSSSSNHDVPCSSSGIGEANGESAQRCKAVSERHQQTAERAAKALAEKNMRDLLAQKEQAERNRLAETLDADVKRWASGKERNLRALLSMLHYILGPDSGWKAIPLTDLISTVAVRKAYLKATLFVHPDKLQQRGASIQQKYTCEKVFDLLKEAWNKFSAEER